MPLWSAFFSNTGGRSCCKAQRPLRSGFRRQCVGFQSPRRRAFSAAPPAPQNSPPPQLQNASVSSGLHTPCQGGFICLSRIESNSGVPIHECNFQQITYIDPSWRRASSTVTFCRAAFAISVLAIPTVRTRKAIALEFPTSPCCHLLFLGSLKPQCVD